ncbi:hypothetical protein [Stenomitos frigidus]|uniref:hypothetical protein n=1 Tax=Stenomitos frigidus TaxID=1886765 RepID=UPI001C629952|nr:hypothetical protein [Stenomitos frigidus]
MDVKPQAFYLFLLEQLADLKRLALMLAKSTKRLLLPLLTGAAQHQRSRFGELNKHHGFS